MTVKPDYPQTLRLNRLVRDLKYGCQSWNETDWFLLTAQHDAQAALVDLRNPARVATAVNSPTFTAYRGYTGDGATSYLNSNAAPGSNFALNSNSMGVWLRTVTGVSVQHLGSSDNGVIGNSSTSTFAARSSGILTGTFSGALTVPGLYAYSRTTSTAIRGYRNGASVGNAGSNSSAVGTADFFVGARNTGGTPSLYSPAQIAAAYAGAGFSDSKNECIHNALSTYMTSVGAQ